MEEILIRKAIKGDKNALIQLIMSRKDEYYRLAFLYMKNEYDSMNMLQEMIIKLYKNISKLKNLEKFYVYSKKILVNLCKDEIRKNKKIIFVDNFQDRETEDEYGLNIEEILLKLDIIYREPIYLKYILEYDYRSIAKILSIPVGTVKSRIHNGLKKLKIELGDDYFVE